MLLEISQKAPAFNLFDHKGNKHSLSDYKDSFVLLYFYPKDFTPGCTAEACSLRDINKELKKAKVTVLGVSLDDADSHKKFVKEHKLPFTILTDEKMKMSDAYGVLSSKIGPKKTTYSLSRTSYLIDPKGKIVKVYAKVNPAKHADQVLKDITKINQDIKEEEMVKRLEAKEKLAKAAAKEKAKTAKKPAKKAAPKKEAKSAAKPAKKAPVKKTATKPTPKKATPTKKTANPMKPVVTPKIPESITVQEMVEVTDDEGNSDVFVEERTITIEE